MVSVLFRFVRTAVCCLAFLLVGCGKKEPPLVVLTTGDVAPFSMKDKNGNLSGFDIDLANLIAASLKRDVVFKCVQFGDVIKQVQAKEVDIGIAALSITEDRKKLVDFSPAYHAGGFALLVLSGTSNNVEDIVSSNRKIGVRQGTWQEQAFKTAWLHKSNLFVQGLDRLDPDSILAQLRSGEFGAILLDIDEAKWLADHHPGVLQVRPVDLGVLEMGIATAKGSTIKDRVAEYFEQNPEEIRRLHTKWLSSASNK